jgi:hypothetical protein
VLVAGGLFRRDGVFQTVPAGDLVPLEELFRARVIAFLVYVNVYANEKTESLQPCGGAPHSPLPLQRRTPPRNASYSITAL